MLRRNVYRSYSSLHDFITDAAKTGYSTGSEDFCGTASLDEAVTLARNGWSDMRPQVNEFTDKLVGKIREEYDFDRQPIHSMVGGLVDIPLWLSNEPEHMVTFNNSDTPSMRVFRMLINPGARGGISADAMLRRASAIAAFVEVCQLAGNNVEIVLSTPVSEGRFRHNLSVLAHEAGEPFDIDKMMFVLGHPSMLRRLWFAHRDADGMSSGMGTSVPFSEKFLSDIGADFVVNRDNHAKRNEPNSLYDPESWVLWALKQVGIIEED